LVTNKTTGKSVIARVNDRTTEEAIKLSQAIKKAIDFDSMAQHEVYVERL
jgi:rare lipoprotein A (peptidoglycan hydrolase)